LGGKRMSMSTHIIGFIPADDKWIQMKRVFDSCEEAGIEIPREVSRFFNDEKPDPNGVEIELKATEWENREYCYNGYELKVSDIPKDVTIIRFYNSY
jgi:hypothetical protein